MTNWDLDEIEQLLRIADMTQNRPKLKVIFDKVVARLESHEVNMVEDREPTPEPVAEGVE